MKTNVADMHKRHAETGDSHLSPVPHGEDGNEIARTFFRYTLNDIAHFSRVLVGRPLRSYQLAVARPVLASVRRRQGLFSPWRWRGRWARTSYRRISKPISCTATNGAAARL